MRQCGMKTKLVEARFAWAAIAWALLVLALYLSGVILPKVRGIP